MKIISFFKQNLIFQNLAARFFSMIPPMIEHNIAKYYALKKAFYLTALEQLDGDYLEFGVFTGSAFVFSTRTHKKMLKLGSVHTRFYGFDSFAGFGKIQSDDTHPFYKNDTFTVDADKIVKNIEKQTAGYQVKIVRGYFEDSLKINTIDSLGIQKSRIVFIDCDLKAPARLALDFVKPTLQLGTVLVMDDFFSYKGSESAGVAGAFNEFNKDNPSIQWRMLYHYGYGGIAYICSAR